MIGAAGPGARGTARSGRILLVEDDAAMRHVYQEALAGRGHSVQVSADGVDALRRLGQDPFDIVVSDVRMPGLDGHRLLQQIQDGFGDVRVILVTGFGQIDRAVEAMRQGAYHYLCKPLRLDALIEAVEQGLGEGPTSMEARFSLSRRPLAAGRDDSLARTLAQAARTTCPVLLEGEPGAGKRAAAIQIHRGSARSAAPLALFDCGGGADSTMRALLGDDRDGEAGAGALERAGQGSVLLRDLDALPGPAQEELTRFLQTGQLRRAGGRVLRQVDVRVLATVTGGMVEAVDAGRLREDLAYRFHLVRLPPLRERLADVPQLVRTQLDEICTRLGRAPRDLSPRALEIVLEHPWPGNLAELQRVLEDGVRSSRHRRIRPRDLPLPAGGRQDTTPPSLRDAVREHVKSVLAQAGGNKLKAAALLGISRPTLYRRLRELGLA